jgi:hypothetical protein
MGHTKDWIEGKIGEVQDKLEKQAVINAQVAAKQAKLEIQILAQQEKIILDEEAQKALAFLFNQQCQRNIRYKFIQRALTESSNDYMGIMQSEAHKGLSLSLLVSLAAFAVVPELAALANAAKVLDDDWKVAIQTAKALGKILDIGKYIGGDNGGGTYGVINQVVGEVLDRILDDEAAMGAIVEAFTNALFAGAPQPLQLVNDFWSQAGLQTLDAAGFSAAKRDSDSLREIVLYDMLHAYTRQYVTISFPLMGSPPTCETLDSHKLADIPNGMVKVSGLNDTQRENIYKRFSAVVRPGRPQISSWRDLVSVWEAAIPGYQTDPRVSAQCIAPKY